MSYSVEFRGREKDTGNILYGFYYNTITSTYNPWNNPIEKDEWDREHTAHYILFDSQGDWGLPHYTHRREVEPNVEMFTGCFDKNGNKIFEGDLIDGSRVILKDGQFITESGIRNFKDYEVTSNPCNW